MGAALTFVNVSSNETITYFGATSVFCFRVPPGKYILDGVGGSFMPENPFSFEVTAGEKVYIGTIMVPAVKFMDQGKAELEKRTNELKDKFRTSKPYRKYFVDTFNPKKRTPYDPPFDFYLFDNSVQLKEKAKQQFPNLYLEDFKIKLMQ